MRKSLAIIILVSAIGASGAARADDDCWAPMSEWQPRAAVQQLAQKQGWTVKRIKIHDGCYRIYGSDANGEEIHVTVNPVTLDIVGSRDDKHWNYHSKGGSPRHHGEESD
jgi:hypothetical protein